MDILIQKTEEKNFFETETITRETFWNLYQSGSDEHLVLHNLRKSKSYVAELDLVAIIEDEVIGHIISTKAKVIDTLNNEHEVLCVGPVTVLPKLQNQGIGTLLLKESIVIAEKLGYVGMILFGDPAYYQRFGFTNAQKYEITTKDNQNFDPFMALELTENGLANVKGQFFEDEAFIVDETELAEFEKRFPAKVKGKPKIDITQYS